MLKKYLQVRFELRDLSENGKITLFEIVTVTIEQILIFTLDFIKIRTLSKLRFDNWKKYIFGKKKCKILIFNFCQRNYRQI